MTLEQVRRRYRLSLIGIPIIMLSMLAVRYGALWNPYMRLVGVVAVVVLGAVILWWGMRYGDMLDAHAAAAKKQPPPPSSSGDDSATEAPEGAK